MNSVTATYKLPFGGLVTDHFAAPAFFVRDQADDEMRMNLQARVRSGDYFMTIATELDEIAQNLSRLNLAGAVEANDLERIVAELFILTQDYTIVKK